MRGHAIIERQGCDPRSPGRHPKSWPENWKERRRDTRYIIQFRVTQTRLPVIVCHTISAVISAVGLGWPECPLRECACVFVCERVRERERNVCLLCACACVCVCARERVCNSVCIQLPRGKCRCLLRQLVNLSWLVPAWALPCMWPSDRRHWESVLIYTAPPIWREKDQLQRCVCVCVWMGMPRWGSLWENKQSYSSERKAVQTAKSGERKILRESCRTLVFCTRAVAPSGPTVLELIRPWFDQLYRERIGSI